MSSPTPTLRVGAYAVCVRDGAVLLARWIGSEPPRWTLPGGGLDHGEDPRDGAIREVEEETGYRVELRQLLTVESFRWLLDRPERPGRPPGHLRDLHGGGRGRRAARRDRRQHRHRRLDPARVRGGPGPRGGLVDIGLAVAGYLPAPGDGAVG